MKSGIIGTYFSTPSFYKKALRLALPICLQQALNQGASFLDMGGGQKPRGGGQVAPSGEDHRVTEPVLVSSAAHRRGQYAVFRGKLHHLLTPLPTISI